MFHGSLMMGLQRRLYAMCCLRERQRQTDTETRGWGEGKREKKGKETSMREFGLNLKHEM